MAMGRYELHDVKVYQLNICEAIGDHHTSGESTSVALQLNACLLSALVAGRSPRLEPASEDGIWHGYPHRFCFLGTHIDDPAATEFTAECAVPGRRISWMD
jgi:hypothetical protein